MDYFRYAAYHIHHLPLHIIALYVGIISLVTFLAYRHDKRAAIYHSWRVSEAWLHILMFMGGTIGAFAGQKILRHKTKKRSFRLKFWLLLVIQLIIIAYIILAF